MKKLWILLFILCGLLLLVSCDEFDIPFNRQQLADYLGVDRSAMSNELSKMQKEGYLTSSKNHFCLNQASLDHI